MQPLSEIVAEIVGIVLVSEVFDRQSQAGCLTALVDRVGLIGIAVLVVRFADIVFALPGFLAGTVDCNSVVVGKQVVGLFAVRFVAGAVVVRVEIVVPAEVEIVVVVGSVLEVVVGEHFLRFRLEAELETPVPEKLIFPVHLRLEDFYKRFFPLKPE